MQAFQQALFSVTDDTRKQTLLRNIPTEHCTISRFNTRKTRAPETVKALAERMVRNGFELTRALWVYEADGHYEVFAGGTRLEAAKLAGVGVDVIVHEGYTWEEISKLSDQDNENDEYHTPVPITDVWADYARLSQEEGWTQQKIADAKGVSQAVVSERLAWHKLPDDVKRAVSTGDLAERHLREVSGSYLPVDILSRWADWQAWRLEALRHAIDKGQSSQQLKKQWDERKDAVERANTIIEALPEGERDEYVWQDETIARVSTDWRAAFAQQLVDDSARTVAAVDRALTTITTRQNDSDKVKQLHEQDLDKEKQALQAQQQKAEAIQARWLHGSCLDYLPTLPNQSVRLLLTDPPYGVDFQSNRRVVSGKASRLENDTDEDAAIKVFSDMLDALSPKLEDEAHLLVFTHWRTEFFFRQALEYRGYVVRGSLVWVKENHTSGDLDGSFAPRHERIIHATRGHPSISPRADDVLFAERENRTEHPTEKPLKLLAQLINSTTVKGQRVVDPFGGVASTLLAARNLEREWWGCELSDEWWSSGYKELGNE